MAQMLAIAAQAPNFCPIPCFHRAKVDGIILKCGVEHVLFTPPSIQKISRRSGYAVGDTSHCLKVYTDYITSFRGKLGPRKRNKRWVQISPQH